MYIYIYAYFKKYNLCLICKEKYITAGPFVTRILDFYLLLFYFIRMTNCRYYTRTTKHII